MGKATAKATDATKIRGATNFRESVLGIENSSRIFAKNIRTMPKTAGSRRVK